MVTGRQVLRSIESRISEAERERGQKKSALSRAERELEKNVETQQEIYVKLARFYLPEMAADTVEATLEELRTDARTIYSKKLEHISAVDNRMERLEFQRMEEELQLDDSNRRVEELEEQKRTLEEQVEESLATNENYTFQKEKYQASINQLEFLQTKLAEKEVERNEKMGSYENSLRFQYLLNAGFGTDDYNRSGIIAKLDKKVALSIGFEEAYENYLILKTVPVVIGKKIDKETAVNQAIREEIALIEAKEMEESGLNQVNETLQSTYREREKYTSSLADITNNMERAREERSALESTQGKYHSKAIDQFAKYFQSKDIQELRRLAEETPSPEDDLYVEKIDSLQRALPEIQENIRHNRSLVDDAEEKLSGLRKVERDFRSRGYDHSRSRFPSGYDIDDLLVGYMLGRYSERNILDSMSSKHYKTSPPRSSYSSSSSSSSSSYSSGGFSSGGGFGGGGGFSSGGGF